MQLESFGILIDLYPFSEKDLFVRIFSRDNGIIVGIIRGGAIVKKNRALVGQIGRFTWNARLESQLGVLHWEPEHNLSAPLIMKVDLLKYMNSAFSLIKSLIPERAEFTNLYDNTLNFLRQLPHSKNALQSYLNWEMFFVGELGYAFDLSKCSGCGSNDNLTFLSPRTGRAVCSKCAVPYMNKLYKLPITTDIMIHFIGMICMGQGIDIPQQRKML